MFIKGDSSKLIENGEFAYDDKTRSIYAALMGNGKKTKDMDDFLRKHYGIHKNGFDVGSIQFAIHYMFKTRETLHTFLRNVAKHIKSGGYFIGTCYDGKRVFEMLKDYKYNDRKDLFVDTHKIWHIQKKYDDDSILDDESCIGMKVSVYQESINREFEEYLVNFDYFIALMKDYGFTPVSEINISKNKKIPSIGTFKNIDDSLNKEFNMSEEEKIIHI